MKSDANSSGGMTGGMSRAAKKRAKKNQKKPIEMKRPSDDSFDQAAVSKKVKVEESMIVSENLEQGPTMPKLAAAEGTAMMGVEDGDDGDDDQENQVVAPTLLDSSNSYMPSLPNTPLTKILLMDDTTNGDETSQKIIESLSANQRATCLFQAIIAPLPIDQFYSEYWEKKPLLIRAKTVNRNRYNNLLSLESVQQMSKDHPLYYGRDLNVTRYQKGKDLVKRRITLDKLPTDAKDEETGVQADPNEIWKNYDNGCTIRLLCPHKHTETIHALLSTLELELQCMVGANAYLTPPQASQGFAPHYDDIEAFCLQLEGSKRWKVYEPTLKLPRVSSEDFTAEDLEGKDPIMDITLEQGDLLYMPRGWIHQACTLKDDNEHSLHLTVSAMQQWAWVDLLDMIMPEALENAAANESSVSLRQGLPRGFLDYMGAMYEEPSDEKLPDSMKKAAEDTAQQNEEVKLRTMLKEKFRSDAKKRIMKVAKTALEMVDAACDQVAKRFMSDRQPFVLTVTEKAQTSRRVEGGEEIDLLPDTLCRLVRPGIARLVIEDEKAIVYHCADNSREYQGNPVSPLEFEMDDGPAIEQLLTTVEPHWIFVNDLFHDTIEDKIAIAQALYDEGVLAVKTQEGTDE